MEPNPRSRPLHPQVGIGHVHLKVSDLERALVFYRDTLGFELTQRYGTQAAFLSAGDYHHHIGLNTWAGTGVPPAPNGTAGLRRFSVELPTRADLDQILARLRAAGIAMSEAADGGYQMPFCPSTSEGLELGLSGHLTRSDPRGLSRE